MPTLQQRLQSRISHRRNFIRELETDVTVFRLQGFGWHAKNLRSEITVLGADQKLDKELQNVLTGHTRIVRHFDDGPFA